MFIEPYSSNTFYASGEIVHIFTNYNRLFLLHKTGFRDYYLVSHPGHFRERLGTR